MLSPVSSLSPGKLLEVAIGKAGQPKEVQEQFLPWRVSEKGGRWQGLDRRIVGMEVKLFLVFPGSQTVLRSLDLHQERPAEDRRES